MKIFNQTLEYKSEKIFRKFCTLLLCSLIVLAPSAQAAMQIFMVSDQIKGESKDSMFAESVELKSLIWGASRDSEISPGPGSVQVTDITVTKSTDASSAEFFRHAVTGEHISEVLIVMRRTSVPPIEYMALRLTDVQIKSFSIAGDEDDDLTTEQASLNFGQLEFFYQQQKEDGQGGPINGFCWDVQANKDC